MHVPRGFRSSRDLREKNVIRRVCRRRTVYLRVCDRVVDKKDLAKQWAAALAAGAEKQQPLGGYRGEDVAAKNPFTKALAARGRLAVAS